MKKGGIRMYEEEKFDLLGLVGFSDELLRNHFKLYSGYIANTNKLIDEMKGRNISSPEYSELKRRFGWEFNGMRLHELYFGNLSKNPKMISEGKLKELIVKEFGDFNKFIDDIKQVASMRGIGWVITYYDPISKLLYNTWVNEHDAGHLSGAIPILVLDVFEHAWMLEYGSKPDYLNSFIHSVDWSTVEKRLKS